MNALSRAKWRSKMKCSSALAVNVHVTMWWVEPFPSRQ